VMPQRQRLPLMPSLSPPRNGQLLRGVRGYPPLPLLLPLLLLLLLLLLSLLLLLLQRSLLLPLVAMDSTAEVSCSERLRIRSRRLLCEWRIQAPRTPALLVLALHGDQAARCWPRPLLWGARLPGRLEGREAHPTWRLRRSLVRHLAQLLLPLSRRSRCGAGRCAALPCDTSRPEVCSPLAGGVWRRCHRWWRRRPLLGLALAGEGGPMSSSRPPWGPAAAGLMGRSP
jgi:hypothetical protein